jgi:magnesium-transporting ATPase (P-type)
MDSKKEKRLYFNWQESISEYYFIVTLLIGLFAIRNEFPENYKLWVYLFMSILIFLTGTGLINTYINKREYLEHIRDRRQKKSRWKIIWEWIIYISIILMAIAVVYVAMNIWKAFLVSK